MILKKMKFVIFAVCGIIFLFGLYTIGQMFSKEDGKDVVVALPKEEALKDYRVVVSDEDFGTLQEVEFIAGYKRPYNFEFTPEEIEEFAFDKVEDKNWIQSLVNSADKGANKKSLSFSVNSETMLGYDAKELKQEDITYNEAEKTLYVKPPVLQMNNVIVYGDTVSDEGYLTALFDSFTFEELDAFKAEAADKVKEKFLDEVDRGYELTNKIVEKEILNSKEYKIDIEKVVFLENDTPVRITIEELGEEKVSMNKK